MLFSRLFAMLTGEKIIAAALLTLLVALGFWAFLTMLMNYFPEFFPTKIGTIAAPKGGG